MRLIIKEEPNCTEVEICITCKTVDGKVRRLVESVRAYTLSVPATKEKERFSIDVADIFYFESVDSRTFLYTEKEVFECNKRLYEIEEELRGTPFIRASKSLIVNVSYVNSVKPQFSGRLEAQLCNGERVIVSKHYIKGFRDKFLQEENR